MRVEIPRHGGAREGAGRPPSNPDDSGPPDPVKDKFDYWKAKSEEFKAKQSELNYLAALGEYVPRAAVQQASATAMNVFVQHARSIGGNLERVLGLTPEVAAAIDAGIDEAMASLADDLKALATAGNPPT